MPEFMVIAKGKQCGEVRSCIIKDEPLAELMIEEYIDSVVDELGDLVWWAVYVLNSDFDSDLALHSFEQYCDAASFLC